MKMKVICYQLELGKYDFASENNFIWIGIHWLRALTMISWVTRKGCLLVKYQVLEVEIWGHRLMVIPEDVSNSTQIIYFLQMGRS